METQVKMEKKRKNRKRKATEVVDENSKQTKPTPEDVEMEDQSGECKYVRQKCDGRFSFEK